MTYNIGVIKGDGIGPEIVTEAVKVLDAVGAEPTSLISSQFLTLNTGTETSESPSGCL